jgi:hypothetical protein
LIRLRSIKSVNYNSSNLGFGTSLFDSSSVVAMSRSRVRCFISLRLRIDGRICIHHIRYFLELSFTETTEMRLWKLKVESRGVKPASYN